MQGTPNDECGRRWLAVGLPRKGTSSDECNARKRCEKGTPSYELREARWGHWGDGVEMVVNSACQSVGCGEGYSKLRMRVVLVSLAAVGQGEPPLRLNPFF